MNMNDIPESAQTQREKLLGHLKAGLPITHRRAEIGYGIQRLAARIFDLRQLGHQIEKRMVEVPTRNGGKTRVAEYWLSGSAA